MIKYLERLVEERQQLDEMTRAKLDEAAEENRELTASEKAQLANWEQRCQALDPEIESFGAQAEATRKFYALQDRIGVSREREQRNTAAAQVERTSFGQAFIDSEQFRSYRGVGSSSQVELGGFLETRAPIHTTNLAIPHFVLPANEVPVRPSPLLELANRVTVSSGVVDWVEIGADPVAGVVAEGAAKPEAAFTMTPKTATLDTLAHWMQISRQALEDAPYVRSLIEGKLRRGLVRKAEADAALALVAATLPTATATTLIASIRVGIGTVQDAGYQPNAVLLNPADYAALDVDVMSATDAGPVIGQRFWGLQPVAAASQPAGTATVGDFSEGLTFFDRGVTNVFLTDSHASLFISNYLVILAEARVKSVVTDLPAFCECTKTP